MLYAALLTVVAMTLLLVASTIGNINVAIRATLDDEPRRCLTHILLAVLSAAIAARGLLNTVKLVALALETGVL